MFFPFNDYSNHVQSAIPSDTIIPTDTSVNRVVYVEPYAHSGTVEVYLQFTGFRDTFYSKVGVNLQEGSTAGVFVPAGIEVTTTSGGLGGVPGPYFKLHIFNLGV